LEREIGRAQRYHRDLSLIMFDIDRFKHINDTYGHLAGDYVLKHLATVIKARIRREDILARYGGEEFAIILPEIDHHNAMQFADTALGPAAVRCIEDSIVLCTRALMMAQAIADVEALDAGTVIARPVQTLVRPEVDAALAMVAVNVRARDLRLEIDVPDDLVV